MGVLSETLEQLRRKIPRYGNTRVNKQNTKATRIQPLLRLLGWNVEDLDDVHLEYRKKSKDNPVDDAILLKPSCTAMTQICSCELCCPVCTFSRVAELKADLVIRRSEMPRIPGPESGPGHTLLNSRLVRLVPGTRAIVQAGADVNSLQLWHCQYFREAEILLFHLADGSHWPQRLKQRWRIMLTACSLRWNLQVRLARRIMMCVLPACWFPRNHSQGAT